MQKPESVPDITSLAPIGSGGAAVITGAASGIGLAAACRFAQLGMPVVLADLPGARLAAAEATVKDAGKHDRVFAVETDVAKRKILSAPASGRSIGSVTLAYS